MSGFAVKALRWAPYLIPVDIKAATPTQLKAMEATPSGGNISPYVLTLAHDPQSYAARTALYNKVMYAEGGLAPVWRELGALVASVVNGCVYCASVHARRHIRLAGDDRVVREIYTAGLDGQFDSRIRATIEFSRALSVTPIAATQEHVAALRVEGFTADEIVDLVHATAMFGWANRLMHVLGYPVQPPDPSRPE